MPISTIPTNQRPGFADNLLQTFIQSMVMERQNKLDKERLSLLERQVQIQEQVAQREAEAARAAGVAGQTEIGLQAQADPAIMQFIQSQFPQTRVDPNAIAQMAAGALRSQPQATAQAGSQVVRPQFDPRQIPVGDAAAVADRVQRFRQSQADLAFREQQTEGQRLDNSLHDLRRDLVNAQVAAQNANTQESLANIRNVERTYRVQLRAQAIGLADQQQSVFREFASIPGFSPADAARIAYDSNTPLTRDVLIEENMRLLDAAALESGSSDEFNDLLQNRRRTSAARRLGVPSAIQQAADAALAQTEDDAVAAFALADEKLDGEELAQVYAYYRVLFPDAEIQRPRERHFFDGLRSFFSTTPELTTPPSIAEISEAARNASPRARSRTGGVM